MQGNPVFELQSFIKTHQQKIPIPIHLILAVLLTSNLHIFQNEAVEAVGRGIIVLELQYISSSISTKNNY